MNDIQDEAYTELCAENERLFKELANLKRLNAEERATIDDLSKLCLRAADALEEDHELIKDFFSKASVRDKFLGLIDELRKAAL